MSSRFNFTIGVLSAPAKFLAVGFAVSLLSGCIMMDTFSQSNQSIRSAEHEIEQAENTIGHDAAIFVGRPTPNLTPIKQAEGPSWTRENVSEPLTFSSLPLDHALTLILSGTGVVTQLAHDVDPGVRLTLEHSGSIESALRKVAALTNYHYSVDENVVKFQAYATRSYSLPVAGGDYSFMVGKKRPDSEEQNQQSSQAGSGSIDTSAFDVDRNQFSTTEASELNPFTDATSALQSIVGQYGIVIPSESSSTILVKTTPDRMRTVDEYMTTLIDEMSSQVLLEVKVIQVTREDSAELGIDWAAVKNTARSQLNFIGESPMGAFTDSIPVAFSGNRSTGTGSVDVLVKALEQQGKVSFVTQHRVLTRSGRIAELELADIEGYLAASRTTNTTDIGSTTELVPGILQGGYTLYSMAKVHGDSVAMIVSNRSSELSPTETVGTDQNFIQLPRMKSNRVNLQQIVSSGTTVIAAAIRREESMQTQASPVRVRWASTSAGARHRVTEIYLLITPTIIRSI